MLSLTKVDEFNRKNSWNLCNSWLKTIHKLAQISRISFDFSKSPYFAWKQNGDFYLEVVNLHLHHGQFLF